MNKYLSSIDCIRSELWCDFEHTGLTDDFFSDVEQSLKPRYQIDFWIGEDYFVRIWHSSEGYLFDISFPNEHKPPIYKSFPHFYQVKNFLLNFNW